MGYQILDDIPYTSINSKILVNCPIHGNWSVKPCNFIYGKTRCPKCANINSKAELEVLEFVTSLTDNIIHGDRTVLGKLELDVFIPDKKLAIEYNGLYRHSEITGKKDKKYHLIKTEGCEKSGYQLLHIFEDEWNNNSKKDIWKSIIKNKLKKNDNIIHGRNCEVKELNVSVCSNFLDINHLQGYAKAKFKYGLYYNDELLCVMTFSHSRFDQNYDYELIRFATKMNTTIVGGFGKLLAHFIRNVNPTNILSYCDRRYSSGTAYEKNGFKFIGNSDPNFYYFNKHKMIRHHNRGIDVKHFSNYNPNLSEWENMQNNGYDRIWDCGNKKFVWNSPTSNII
jgi:hypothetical protein